MSGTRLSVQSLEVCELAGPKNVPRVQYSKVHTKECMLPSTPKNVCCPKREGSEANIAAGERFFSGFWSTPKNVCCPKGRGSEADIALGSIHSLVWTLLYASLMIKRAVGSLSILLDIFY